MPFATLLGLCEPRAGSTITTGKLFRDWGNAEHVEAVKKIPLLYMFPYSRFASAARASRAQTQWQHIAVAS